MLVADLILVGIHRQKIFWSLDALERVFVDVLLGRLAGIVRGIKRHVHKEGPLILFGHAKVINGVVSHDVAPVPTAFPEAFKLRIKWTPRIGFAG